MPLNNRSVPGDKLTAGVVHDILRRIDRLENLRTEPPLELTQEGGNPCLRVLLEKPQLVEVVDQPYSDASGEHVLPVVPVGINDPMRTSHTDAEVIPLKSSLHAHPDESSPSWWKLVPNFKIGDRLFIVKLDGEWYGLAAYESDPV